jgi:serine/threonine protein kinase
MPRPELSATDRRNRERASEGKSRHQVFKGTDEDGQAVVLKEYKLNNAREVRVLEKEVSRLKQAKHPCVVPVLKVFQDGGNGYLVMPFYPNGDLEQFVASQTAPNAAQQRVSDSVV